MPIPLAAVGRLAMAIPWDRLGDGLNKTFAAAKNLVPGLVTKCSATVSGNPTASMADIYKTALALVMGALRRSRAGEIGLLPPGTRIFSHHDWTNRSCSVEVVLTQGGLTSVVSNLI
ncbi:hypothetical protein [Limnoglobus roseus]|uniref:Uncharacterized protein n=1 Tax=Limnoglobus roseus TaxID=2598579 RepID=A0A5C1AIW9_9BACT|nr:hypothetical protein [Limnoglobus roseus]QEL16918.1 hypothetical protein PX52LOC_03894 [Limnoglobus roseus]